MRVRPLGSHHQKMVVMRHPGRPELDVAFVGGIDLCHSRRDSEEHPGDPQAQAMASVYGPHPPWHDIQLALRGPAVADVETVFRERWDDPQPTHPQPRPPHRRPPGSRRRHAAGRAAAGGLRSRPPRAPASCRSCAPTLAGATATRSRRTASAASRGYSKALRRASLADLRGGSVPLVPRRRRNLRGRAARADRELRLIAVVPHHPDQDGPAAVYPQHLGRQASVRAARRRGRRSGRRLRDRERRGDTDLRARQDVRHRRRLGRGRIRQLQPSLVDVGLRARRRRRRRGLDEREPADPGGLGDGARRFARHLRLALAREHLGRRADDVDDLLDPPLAFEAFARAAAGLQSWHEGGRRGPRPPGRVTPAWPADVPRSARWWASPLYRLVYDPDGRSLTARRRGTF